MERVYTPVNAHEKAMQRALIQYRKPENYALVKEALIQNNRMDLIGFDKKCLIPPRQMKSASAHAKKRKDRQTHEKTRKR